MKQDLSPQAVDLARERGERCFQLCVSHPVRKTDRHPKMEFGSSGILPEKFYGELLRFVTRIMTRHKKKT